LILRGRGHAAAYLRDERTALGTRRFVGAIMPLGVRMLIIFGTISLFSTLVISLALGGGFASGVFPPNESVEMTLVPVARSVDPTETPPPPQSPRLEIPEEFRAPDQTPPVAYQGPDGVWRFRD
jgi:hypothetical protein